jgi:acyl-CoA synthetase (AMP-forming)/AMP-acid ligase II
VIGVPDEHWGQSVLAFVVARDGSAPEEAQIIEFCQSRIASYKKPSRVEFTESLPRASTGKIDKVALREPYWRGLERKV